MNNEGNYDMMYLESSTQRHLKLYFNSDSFKMFQLHSRKVSLQNCKEVGTLIVLNFTFNDSCVNMSYEKQCKSLIESLVNAEI